MNENIFIILPFKESLDPIKSGAVSIYVKDILKYSKYKKILKLSHQVILMILDCLKIRII